MPNSFDLQIQSTASDGKHAPAEIVRMAKQYNVLVIALTDHDTVAGVSEALAAGKEEGVRVIPGIEISVEERGAHILGYGIDHENHSLWQDFFEQCRKNRMDGAQKMTDNLRQAGFVIDWEDVLRQATGAVVARPHIARAILARPENREKLGGIDTSHDFIQKHLTDESPYYVRRAHISAGGAIALIHNAGGVAVWSHPAIHFEGSGKYVELEKFLKKLIFWGIDGLEVFTPAHAKEDAEQLYSLAGRYSLLHTGGSDFHERGDHAPDARGLHSARTLGDFETHGFPADEIVPRLDAAMAKRKAAAAS